MPTLVILNLGIRSVLDFSGAFFAVKSSCMRLLAYGLSPTMTWSLGAFQPSNLKSLFPSRFLFLLEFSVISGPDVCI